MEMKLIFCSAYFSLIDKVLFPRMVAKTKKDNILLLEYKTAFIYFLTP